MGLSIWCNRCISTPYEIEIVKNAEFGLRDVTRFTAPRTFLKLRKRHALKNAVDKKKPYKMIVALARKLLVALWKFVTRREVPEDVILNPAT